MADQEDAIGTEINEMYGIASELSISSDKTVQELGKQLRKLVEQVERKFPAK
ncbi:MAG: hypothetical protein P4N59_29540 [Negativicutes bacterium]|nr:hypothetical protein [Negativicutes bacterium]